MSGEFVQYPGSARSGETPLEWEITTTYRRVSKELPGRHTATERTTTKINFAEYGISNPVVARACTGLLELGILRDPQDLHELLTASQQNRPKDQTNPSLTDITHAVIPDISAEKAVMSNFVIAKDHLSRIYAFFMPLILSLRFDTLIEELMQHKDQAAATSYIDTFIKTYVGIRRSVLGATQAFYKKGLDWDTALKKMARYADKKLFHLAEVHKQTFKTDTNEYMTKRNSSNLEQVLELELNSGGGFLANIYDCPVNRRTATKTTNNLERKNTETKLWDITSGNILTSAETINADGVVPLRLSTGKTIQLYSMRACPFVAHTNHPTATNR